MLVYKIAVYPCRNGRVQICNNKLASYTDTNVSTSILWGYMKSFLHQLFITVIQHSSISYLVDYKINDFLLNIDRFSLT